MFTWADYLVVADELTNRSATYTRPEAAWRAAISRAYYAAYWAARGFATTSDSDLGRQIQSGESHIRVIDWFKKQGNREYQQLGEQLLRLKDKRIIADYRSGPGNTVTWADAMAQVDAAKRIRDRVTKLANRGAKD